MAEAYARQYGGPGLEVLSAGVQRQAVDPDLVELLKEIGIESKDPVSQQLTADHLQQADIVVTLCDPEQAVCPVPPAGVRHVNWTIPGPAHFSSDRREGLRAVRDAIVTETRRFLADLSVSGT